MSAIAPAVIATPMNGSTAPQVPAHITSLVPMRRVGEVALLASDKTSFSTGAVYEIGGARASN